MRVYRERNYILSGKERDECLWFNLFVEFCRRNFPSRLFTDFSRILKDSETQGGFKKKKKKKKILTGAARSIWRKSNTTSFNIPRTSNIFRAYNGVILAAVLVPRDYPRPCYRAIFIG